MITHIFFFNDTATTEIYTLSLHDALPISLCSYIVLPIPNSQSPIPLPKSRSTTNYPDPVPHPPDWVCFTKKFPSRRDRKSTRLNSSHANISYAVFCLKKKNIHHTD